MSSARFRPDGTETKPYSVRRKKRALPLADIVVDLRSCPGNDGNGSIAMRRSIGERGVPGVMT